MLLDEYIVTWHFWNVLILHLLVIGGLARYRILDWEIFFRFLKVLFKKELIFYHGSIFICYAGHSFGDLFSLKTCQLGKFSYFRIFDFLSSVFSFFPLQLMFFRKFIFQNGPLIVLSLFLFIRLLLYFLSNLS